MSRSSPTTGEYRLPKWLKPMNKTFLALRKIGLGPADLHLLTVVGRRSGKPRTTPISIVELTSGRYVVGGFPGADWVANARAAGTGILATKRESAAVRLIELAPAEARPILREFPIRIPDGADIMVNAGVVGSKDPAEFETLAGRCAVFRIE